MVHAEELEPEMTTQVPYIRLPSFGIAVTVTGLNAASHSKPIAPSEGEVSRLHIFQG